MKITKIARFGYCLLFFCLCAIPGVTMLGSKEEETSENRTLAAFPSFVNEDGSFNSKWSTEFQSYVSDHFGFRSELVTADSLLKAKLLHTSAEDDVIIGSDGWLYYSPTVNDFIENPTVSDLGIQNIRRNLELMQAYTESKGGEFLVTVVPNKNTVYPQYMPIFYQKSGVENNLARLTASLTESGVPYCDMAAALKTAAEQSPTPIYHKHDSHWNNTGALIGYDALLDTAGLTHEDLAAQPYTTEAIWEGDLQRMLFPDSDVLDMQNVYDIPFTYNYMGHFKDMDDLNIDTMNPQGSGTLLMFRDSFGAAIIPYLSEHFAMAKYSRSRPYPLHNLESMPYETVIVEIVERNIAWLQKEAPMHPALPAEQVPASAQECSALLETMNDGTKYIHLYGTTDCVEGSTNAPIHYVTLTDSTGASASYLAYNCYEADLFETETIQDNGYSLYIDSTTLTAGETYTITVTTQTDTGVYSCTFKDVSLEETVK